MQLCTGILRDCNNKIELHVSNAFYNAYFVNSALNCLGSTIYLTRCGIICHSIEITNTKDKAILYIAFCERKADTKDKAILYIVFLAILYIVFLLDVPDN